MSTTYCCVLSKDPSFNLTQYEETSGGPQLLQLPLELIAKIGRFVDKGPNGAVDASRWGSVCVLTHQLWHQEREESQALETIWSKMPQWCCFVEHIEYDGSGGSWGGGRPTKAREIRCWFEDYRYNHQRAKVEELYLLALNLEVLPPEMAALTQLRYIDLSGNNFSCVPRVLGACPNLTQIILNNNKITEIPGWLTKKCPKLWNVELLNNPVSDKPEYATYSSNIFVLQ